MTTTAAPQAVSSIDLPTTDLDRCCDFYVDLLGLRRVVVLRQTEAPHHRHALLQVGDSPTMLHVLERPDAAGAPASRIGLLVPDLDALDEVAQRLCEAGASDGEVRFQGPTFAVTYLDHDGREGEIHAPNPDFAPSATDRCRVDVGPG